MSATTREMIAEWFDRGLKKKATHMLVVCDTFDYDDYPVFVGPNEEHKDVRETYEHFNGPNMQRVMEVYDLRKDKSQQLGADRVFNF